MVSYQKYTLENGLTLLVHVDKNTPIAAVNALYDVGARDESSDKTGFAHLFEHLMFGGSRNIPNYDSPLQQVGGQNNAFTNNDITNYYITLPKANIETAFWLESDRMLSLAFTPESLEVQRKVVVEEFRQQYLNQPYGDLWLHLRPLAYKTHPYQWPTIGKVISHIEEATMTDVKDFFSRHYHPANAILSVGGNVDPDQIFDRVNHWFGDIPKKEKFKRNLPEEPFQSEHRLTTLQRDVPQDALHLVWHMPGRTHPDFSAADMLSDILSLGNSARLTQALVKQNPAFTSLNLYVLGSRDPGLMVCSGMLSAGVSHEEARNLVLAEIEKLLDEGPTSRELEKVKNRCEMNHILPETSVLSKTMNLAYHEWLGDANGINTVLEDYRKVTAGDVVRVGKEIFNMSNMSELRYQKNQD